MKDTADTQGFDIDAARDAIRVGAPLAFEGIDVVTTEVHGRRFQFAVDTEHDPVQRNHRKGGFYEARELNLLKTWFPLGGVFVDFGANIGNHCLFVAGFLSPARVIPVEPNPRAVRLLLANVVMNGFEDVIDLEHLGYGVSDKSADDFGVEERETNIGAVRIFEGQGTVPVRPGDEILADQEPSLIKIDVEGMELRVLSGLAETIDRTRPPILIEVDNTNEDAFLTWCEAQSYKVQNVHQRYRTNKNYFIRPRRRSPRAGDRP